MAAGTTLMDFLLIKQFWNQLAIDRQKGLAIQETISRVQRITGLGMLLLILSGITMMVMTRGVFGEQMWFRIKFGLVIVIIISQLAIRRRQGRILAKRLDEPREQLPVEALPKIRRNINGFHFFQLALFVVIFTLSVFKFN